MDRSETPGLWIAEEVPALLGYNSFVSNGGVGFNGANRQTEACVRDRELEFVRFVVSAQLAGTRLQCALHSPYYRR